MIKIILLTFLGIVIFLVTFAAVAEFIDDTLHYWGQWWRKKRNINWWK